jgi:hypothetical protein
MEELANPALSLSIELAGAHNLRCQILASRRPREADRECQQTFDILRKLGNRSEAQTLYRDLGYNYVDLAKAGGEEAVRARENLSRILPEIPEPDRTTLRDWSRQSR